MEVLAHRQLTAQKIKTMVYNMYSGKFLKTVRREVKIKLKKKKLKTLVHTQQSQQSALPTWKSPQTATAEQACLSDSPVFEAAKISRSGLEGVPHP